MTCLSPEDLLLPGTDCIVRLSCVFDDLDRQ